MVSANEQPKITTEPVLFQKKVCRSECMLLLDHSSYNDLIYTVHSLNDLDPKVKDMIVDNLPPADDLCQIIVCPNQKMIDERQDGSESKDQKLHQWNYDWVLVLTNENILLFDAEHSPNVPQVMKAPVKNLVMIEWGKILFRSWISWSWLDEDCIGHAQVAFSSTGEKPIVELLVFLFGSNDSIKRAIHLPSMGLEEKIKRIPPKFVDRIPLLLTPQEGVLAIEYSPFQPSTWKSWHGLFKKLENKSIPASVLILTDRRIIIVREEENDSGHSFGNIIQTIQLKDIQNMFVDYVSERKRLIIEIGNNVVRERISVDVSERCFDEISEKFRSYLSSR